MTSEPYNHLTDPLRSKRITASMAGAILGNSPWMTREDAMRSMVRSALGAPSENEGNIATEYGNNHEAGAIIEFQMETGLTVTPSKFIVCEHEPIFGCSPDGLIGDDAGLEQKCPFGLRKAVAPAPFKTLADQPQYYDQVQLSLYVTGRSIWHFSQWCPTDTKREIVEPSQQWRDASLPILRQFHAEFLDTIASPELSAEHLAPRRVTIDTPAAQKALREWDEIAEQLDLLNERKADLLADITAMAKGKDALIAGRKVTLVEKAGSVRYAAVVKEKLKGLDLSPWTGKSSTYWKIT